MTYQCLEESSETGSKTLELFGLPVVCEPDSLSLGEL